MIESIFIFRLFDIVIQIVLNSYFKFYIYIIKIKYDTNYILLFIFLFYIKYKSK